MLRKLWIDIQFCLSSIRSEQKNINMFCLPVYQNKPSKSEGFSFITLGFYYLFHPVMSES